MPDFIFHLPLFASGVLVIGVLCAYCLLGLLIARRWVLPRWSQGDSDAEFSGAMVQAVMVFYGLAVALVAVSVWENHSEVSGIVSREASQVAGFYRDASGYPEPVRAALLDEVEGYTRYVIAEAWPRQREGQQALRGVEWLDRIQSTLGGFEPKTEGQKILHAEALGEFNRLVEARRVRIDATRSSLPQPLWLVVTLGAFVSLASTFFFNVKDVKLHAVQSLLVAVFVGLVITLIIAFDRPFTGDLAIEPEPYQLAIEHLTK